MQNIYFLLKFNIDFLFILTLIYIPKKYFLH